jgi:hypothetical protein
MTYIAPNRDASEAQTRTLYWPSSVATAASPGRQFCFLALIRPWRCCRLLRECLAVGVPMLGLDYCTRLQNNFPPLIHRRIVDPSSSDTGAGLAVPMTDVPMVRDSASSEGS